MLTRHGGKNRPRLSASISAGPDSRATTNGFLVTIRATKPSLTPEIVADFEDDTERFARD